MNQKSTPLLLKFSILASLICSLGLSHFASAAESYRLIPEDLSPQNHPSLQEGYLRESESSSNYPVGTLRYEIPNNPEFTTEGFYSAKRVQKTKQEMLKDSLIRYELDIQRERSVELEGEEYKDKEEHSISGKPLLIDLKKAAPSVEFEDDKLKADEDQKWQMKQLRKEFQARKTLNPWTEDRLIYGQEERQVGDSWTLNEQELNDLEDWLTQVYLGNQGSYRITSLEIEFLEVKEINAVPHAILKAKGILDAEFIEEEEEQYTASTRGELSMSIERNLKDFIDSRSEMSITGTFEYLGEEEQGFQTRIESTYQLQSKETITLSDKLED